MTVMRWSAVDGLSKTTESSSGSHEGTAIAHPNPPHPSHDICVPDRTPIAFADQEGSPPPYTATTPDSRHVFRVLASYEVDRPYPASGMYLNDGLTVPLWTVDWNEFAFVPSGGEHVVREGRWAQWSGSYSEEALTFFSNGQPLKTYTTGDLIDFPWLLPHTVAHYRWLPAWGPAASHEHAALSVGGEKYSNASVTFDDEHQLVHVLTLLGDQVTFDLRTGEIVSATRTRAVTTYGIFAGLLIAYIGWRLMYRGRLSGSPRIGPSNVLVGAVFTFALVVIPTTAAQFFRPMDASEGDSYAYFLQLGFETLPHYAVAFLGAQRPELTPSGSALVVWFWLTCLTVFTVLDRVVELLAARISRREINA